jgi:hypothetical protein
MSELHFQMPKCSSGTFKILVNARSGTDQVLSAWRTESGVVVWCLGRPPLFVSQHWQSSVQYRTLTNRGVRWTSLNLTRSSDFGERFFNKTESHSTGPQISTPTIPVWPLMHTPNRQTQDFHSLTLRKPDVSAELVSVGSLLRERSQR